MDEKRLRQTLHDIAEQEIGEDMNLLPEIMAQLENTNTPRTRKSVWRMGRMVALVAILLMSVAAVYAVYRQQLGDPGLDAAREANLVTELEMSETIDDLTVTLNWVYADGHRIVLGYAITPPEGELAYIYSPTINISDADDSFYSTGGGGGGGGSDELGATADYTASFSIGFYEDAPEELDMHVEITLNDDGNYPDGSDGSGGGGGGGGGGGFGFGGGGDPEATPVPGVTMPEDTSAVESIGPFVYEFTMPYFEDLIVDVMQTTEANGINMRLESLAVAPSMTSAILCYDIPEEEGDWAPDLTVTMNDVTVEDSGWAMIGTPTPEDLERCYNVTYPAPYLREPTTLTLTVDRLQTPQMFTAERIEHFIEILSEQGIEVEISGDSGETGFGYSMIDAPEGVDTGLIINDAWDEAFTESIEGPWTFTVEIP